MTNRCGEPSESQDDVSPSRLASWEGGTMVGRLVTCLVLAALAVAACGGPAATVAPSASAPATSAPSQSAAPVATATPTALPSAASSGYTCSLPISQPGTAAGAVQAVPTAVRFC